MLALAFDECRDSLGTCFQDVRKGGGAVGLQNCYSRMNLRSHYSGKSAVLGNGWIGRLPSDH